MARVVAAAALAAIASAATTCGLDLNTYLGSTQYQIQFPIQLKWQPYFNIIANGTQVGEFRSVCPSYTRQFTLTANGGQVMRFQSEIPLFGSLWSGAFSKTNVYDCHDNLVGSIVESFADQFVNNFGFSTHYQLQDASGNGVGESDSDYFARTLSVKNAANTTEVGHATWAWTVMSVWLSGPGISIQKTTPGDVAGRPEMVLALTTIGYLRYISGTKGSSGMDDCSRFVFVGVPVLGGIWLCTMLFMLCAFDNKLIALVLGLAMPIILGVFLAALLITGLISLVLSIFTSIIGCCCKIDNFNPAYPFAATAGVFAQFIEWVCNKAGSSKRTAANLRAFSTRSKQSMRTLSSRRGGSRHVRTGSDSSNSGSTSLVGASDVSPASVAPPPVIVATETDDDPKAGSTTRGPHGL